MRSPRRLALQVKGAATAAAPVRSMIWRMPGVRSSAARTARWASEDGASPVTTASRPDVSTFAQEGASAPGVPEAPGTLLSATPTRGASEASRRQAGWLATAKPSAAAGTAPQSQRSGRARTMTDPAAGAAPPERRSRDARSSGR
jgi:hypothetical protein